MAREKKKYGKELQMNFRYVYKAKIDNFVLLFFVLGILILIIY